MKKSFLVIAMLALFSGILLGQSSNATITGFVQDSSKAFVPGVTVTATNIQTDVTVTTLSNESGSYTIQSLLPGTYRLSAALTGFSTQTINNVVLGSGVSVRYTFTMALGQAASTRRRHRIQFDSYHRSVVQHWSGFESTAGAGSSTCQ